MELMICKGLFIVICALKFRGSETYTKCLKPDTGKRTFGTSCSDDTQCLTEYCRHTTCSCPDGSVLDSQTGFCVKTTGDTTITAKNGDCGYIVSTGDISYNTVVQWNISGDTDTYVTLVILEVNMNTLYCSSNYVEVLEGTTTLGSALCRSNDYTAKYQASKSNRLTVNYRGTTKGYTGFRAVFFIRNNSAVLTEQTGYIASPGYPLNYKIYSQYTWLITARPGQVITLSTSGSIVSTSDYVYIYDGQYRVDVSLLKNYTVPWPMQSVTSRSNYMLVVFSTSYSWYSSLSYYGFSGSYQVYGVLYGESCNITDTCIQGLTCLGGVCGCLASQYYNQTTCKSRLPSGSYCNNQDICAQGLICSGWYCKCNGTQFYDQASLTCRDKLRHGYPCSNADWCVPGLSCEGRLCGCISSQYYDPISANCSNRRSYWAPCLFSEECKQAFVCLASTCRCSSSQYYDYMNQSCKNAVLYGDNCSDSVNCVDGLHCSSGVCNCPLDQYYDKSLRTCKNASKPEQQCDSSIKDMCESADFVCRLEVDNNYNSTCQRASLLQNTTLSTTALKTEETGDNTTLIAVAVVAAVGWAVAIVAVMFVIITCCRNRKKSATNGGGSELRNTTGTKGNDYRNFPQRADQDSLEYVNKEYLEVTPSVQSTTTVQTTKPVTTRHALGVKQPETSPTSIYNNESFQPESNDEDDMIYEQI